MMDRQRLRRLRSDKDMIAIPSDAGIMEQQNIVDHRSEEMTIDVRAIPRPTRHPLIFDTFDQLDLGEYFCVVSDHDPRPLHYLFDVRYPGAFTWDYVEKGPDVWRVCVGRAAQAE